MTGDLWEEPVLILFSWIDVILCYHSVLRYYFPVISFDAPMVGTESVRASAVRIRKRPSSGVPLDRVDSSGYSIRWLVCEVHMLHVATDAVMKIYRRGLMRAGRTTPPRIEIAVDRWAHAYRPNTDLTLCGLKVDKLHWQPFRRLDFAAVNAAFHCPRCSVAAMRR